MMESRAERLSKFINEIMETQKRGPTAEELRNFDNELTNELKERREKIEQFKVENDEKLRTFVTSERGRIEKEVKKGKFLPGTELTLKVRVTEEGEIRSTAHGCSSPGFRGSWNVTPEGEITKEEVLNNRPYNKVEVSKAA